MIYLIFKMRQVSNEYLFSPLFYFPFHLMCLPFSLDVPIYNNNILITLLYTATTNETKYTGIDVSTFQKANNLDTTGVFEETTANLLLQLHSADGYKDNGFTAASMGYLYKIHVPVHENRSIETIGTLFDAYNNVLLNFPVRNHGHREDCSNDACIWPDFGDGDYGLNQFTTNGNSVTGLIEVDLNSGEEPTDLYGPWPVNRYVRGLEGNAQLLLPNIRDGILLHTGNWTTDDHGTWDPRTMNMPNSAGCHHSHPIYVETIYKILTVELCVVVNDNPFSGKNYPYKPQGIAVVELID